MTSLPNATKSIAVFLGPSLHQEQARQILDANYYPPARKGDVYKIIASGVHTIILLDGVFHNTPSVWQRELLDAITEGILVIGAASMGALRAAELHSLGMVGYGTIFEWYRDGVVEGDDEVALLHGPEDFQYQPLSTPLVNIRYTLIRAVEDNCITDEQAQQLIEYAKRLHYPNRSYEQLLQSQVVNSWPKVEMEKLTRYLSTGSIDLKKLDAAGALQYCANQGAGLRRTNSHAFNIPTSTRQKYDRLLLTGFTGSQSVVTGEEVLRDARKDSALVNYMWPILSKRYFVLEWARRNGLEPTSVANIGVMKLETEEGTASQEHWLRTSTVQNSYLKRIV